MILPPKISEKLHGNEKILDRSGGRSPGAAAPYIRHCLNVCIKMKKIYKPGCASKIYRCRSATVRDRLYFATTTQDFYVVRNGLHDYQCYCSHMTTQKVTKTHHCCQVRMDPKRRFLNEYRLVRLVTTSKARKRPFGFGASVSEILDQRLQCRPTITKTGRGSSYCALNDPCLLTRNVTMSVKVTLMTKFILVQWQHSAHKCDEVNQFSV